MRARSNLTSYILINAINHRPDGVVGYHVSLTGFIATTDKALGSNPSLVRSFFLPFFSPFFVFVLYTERYYFTAAICNESQSFGT